MRILSLTSIRSDYDLMSPIYRQLAKEDSNEFGIVVAGAHHSIFHGQTAKIVYADGLNVVADIYNFTGQDEYLDQVLSGAKVLESLGQVMKDFVPSLAFTVGDREDALMMATAATYMRVPVIHFYGGDHASDGHVDNQVRHAISKLASFHFVSTEFHRERLLSMGEDDDRIRVVGSMAIDNFFSEKIVERSMLFRKLFGDSLHEIDSVGFFLYHPIVQEIGDFEAAFDEIVRIIEFRGMHLVVGKSNNDPKFLSLQCVLEKYESHPMIHFIESLERNDHINLLRNIEVMIGNSSSGILEMSSLKIPVVNIGIRQRGRFADENVIFSKLIPSNISESIELALSPAFRDSLTGLQSSYGDGHSATRVLAELRSIDFSKYLKKDQDPLKSPRIFRDVH
jgi:UDP-hydrolysing UDP-N-acetyl-D-glucosamine 2-epimerase